MVIDGSVSNLSYDELFEQYGRLIYKFCDYTIDGLTREDIYQELCIVLVKCQKKFIPGHMSKKQTKPAKFSTYFVNALKWKMSHLMYRAGKRIVVWQSIHDQGDDETQHKLLEGPSDPHADQDFEEAMFNLDLLKLPAKMQERCHQIMNMRRRNIVLPARDEELIAEVKRTLVGYNKV